MRKRILAALLFAMAAAGPGPALAAEIPAEGVPPDSQIRATTDTGYDLIWDVLGLVGLIGLVGLWRPSDNDGYTDDPI